MLLSAFLGIVNGKARLDIRKANLRSLHSHAAPLSFDFCAMLFCLNHPHLLPVTFLARAPTLDFSRRDGRIARGSRSRFQFSA